MPRRRDIEVHLRRRRNGNHEYWYAAWTDSSGKGRQKGLGRVGRVSKSQAARLCRDLEYEFGQNPDRSEHDLGSVKLSEWMQTQIDKREDKSPRSVVNTWRRTRDLVLESGIDPEIATLTRRDADGLLSFLESPKLGFQEQTVRHHISRLRTAMNDAIAQDRRKLGNPFGHIPCGVLPRDRTWAYVKRETVWNLVYASRMPSLARVLVLTRFCGLRANEAARYAASDLNSDRRTLTVLNPHEDGRRTTKKRERVVPVHWVALEWLSNASPEPVSSPEMKAEREHLRLIQAELKCKPWPDPLQTLRRSCITDWCGNPKLSVAEVALISGNSPEVVMRHYVKVSPDTIEKVAGPRDEPLTTPQNPSSKHPGRDSNTRPAV